MVFKNLFIYFKSISYNIFDELIFKLMDYNIFIDL